MSHILGSSETRISETLVEEKREKRKQNLTYVICLFQYSLNERKLLEMRTEMVALVRNETNFSWSFYSSLLHPVHGYCYL